MRKMRERGKGDCVLFLENYRERKNKLWKIIFYCLNNMGSREKIEREILKKIV